MILVLTGIASIATICFVCWAISTIIDWWVMRSLDREENARWEAKIGDGLELCEGLWLLGRTTKTRRSRKHDLDNHVTD